MRELKKIVYVTSGILLLTVGIVCAEDKLPPEDQALQVAINRFSQCQLDNVTSQQDQARIWLGQYNRLVVEQERLKKELLALQEKSSPKEKE
jgi:hypothetical protein